MSACSYFESLPSTVIVENQEPGKIFIKWRLKERNIDIYLIYDFDNYSYKKNEGIRNQKKNKLQ